MTLSVSDWSSFDCRKRAFEDFYCKLVLGDFIQMEYFFAHSLPDKFVDEIRLTLFFHSINV